MPDGRTLERKETVQGVTPAVIGGWQYVGARFSIQDEWKEAQRRAGFTICPTCTVGSLAWGLVVGTCAIAGIIILGAAAIVVFAFLALVFGLGGRRSRHYTPRAWKV